MKRRTFLAGLGTAAVWARALSAQQADRVRKIGVLLNFRRDDPEGQVQLGGFRRALQELGWTEGTNLRTEIRWPGDDGGLYSKYAQELVAIEPEVILAAARQPPA